ncbi:MAG: efflux transporter outer membrane subunit [Pseudoxanthomonas sp.]|nr:efflux transporter outer membrane subunit [Pseudoxanthomonas sp.]
MAPAYQAPPSPVPPAWPASAPLDAATRLAPPLGWQDYFTDPLLRQLIQTALDNNRDLRVAALRAEEARAAFQIQRADQFPTIGGNAQAARARVPGDLNGSGQSVVGSEYRAEVGLSTWELDLWGRVRNLKQAALERWLATGEGRRSVELALVAQVADGYIGLREIDERLARARRSVATRVESERIYTRRYEVGSSSRLELTQVQTLLAQAQVLQMQLEQARALQLHAFGQLLGADPGPLPPVLPFDEATVLADLSPGLPSDLLLARPDILAAEHQLRAANADIGAARAAFFPQISLTGSYGSASTELDGLFDAGSRAWNFVPLLHVPIFNGGRLRANLDLSEVRRDITVAQYEQSIQTAFREVADALAVRHWAAERLDVQRRALQAISERARLAQLRYSAGSASFIEVLDAQRDLLDAEQQVVQFQRELLSSQVALYAALGGGTAATEGTAATPPGDNRQGPP